MRDLMIRTAMGAVIVVGLAACGKADVTSDPVANPAPERVEVAETEDDSDAAAPTLTGDSDVDVALIDEPIVVPVAQCLVPDDYFADGMTPACTLVTADAQGLALTITPPATEAESDNTELTIDVAAQDGAVVQTLTETVEGTYATAQLNDLNGDGVEELLVPLYTGNVNTVYGLWTRAPETSEYVRVGELSGVSFDILDAGVFGVPARSSAAEWEIQYHQLNGNELSTVAIVTQNLANETCEIVNTGAYAALDLTAETAKDALCTIS